MCRPAGPDSSGSARIPREAFLHVVRHAPLVSVDLIVENPEGEVLLGLRENEPARRTWFVPGGVVRKGERLAAAVARVARDELGVAVDPADAEFVGAFEHLYDTNFAGLEDMGTHYVVLAHRVRLGSGTALVPDAQHGRLKWWRWEAAVASPQVHPYTKAYAGL